MTLIVHPEGIQKSGHGGGTVHGHARYGAYRRNRSKPVNTHTLRQATMRKILARLSNDWQNTLTQAQRSAWEVYAANVPWSNKLGQSVKLTGAVHFVRSNSPRLQGGALIVLPAPVIFNLAAPEQELTFNPALAAQILQVDFEAFVAPWLFEDEAHQFFYFGRPTGPGVSFFRGPWRFAHTVDGDSVGPPGPPINMTSPWAVAPGMKLWIRSRISRADGRLSEFAYATEILT